MSCAQLLYGHRHVLDLRVSRFLADMERRGLRVTKLKLPANFKKLWPGHQADLPTWYMQIPVQFEESDDAR